MFIKSQKYLALDSDHDNTKRRFPETHETKVKDEYIDKYVYICYTPGEALIYYFKNMLF